MFARGKHRLVVIRQKTLFVLTDELGINICLSDSNPGRPDSLRIVFPTDLYRLQDSSVTDHTHVVNEDRQTNNCKFRGTKPDNTG